MASPFDPTADEDLLAGFEAAGVDLSGSEPQPDSQPESANMSQEDMIYTHFIDELISRNKRSKDYQDKVAAENTKSLQQADSLRRKLGG